MAMTCRHCNSPLVDSFVNLGMAPLCESYVSEEALSAGEVFYPLHAFVCSNCFLVQLDAFVSAEEIFGEYAYFSSYSESWLNHAKRYVTQITKRLNLGPKSQVIEIASNDGYLLQYFAEEGIPCIGIEPAQNVAKVAIDRGIETRMLFLTEKSARDLAMAGAQADLLIGNNVLAQVPDLNDFIKGLKLLMKPDGVLTLEFPHLFRLIEGIQYDTIYHEHFCYFSFYTLNKIFSSLGLVIYNVEKLSTHGGSLRIYARHSERGDLKIDDTVTKLLAKEIADGVADLATYAGFNKFVERSKRQLVGLLMKLKNDGKTIVGYGAPGKGNTLLNYCGIRTDILDFTVDKNPYKQGMYLPGTRIPIFAPDQIENTKPDYVLILPWNLQTEIMDQISYVRNWGGKFISPIPQARVVP